MMSNAVLPIVLIPFTATITSPALSPAMSAADLDTGGAPTMISCVTGSGMSVAPTPMRSNFCILAYASLSNTRVYLSPMDDTRSVTAFITRPSSSSAPSAAVVVVVVVDSPPEYVEYASSQFWPLYDLSSAYFLTRFHVSS